MSKFWMDAANYPTLEDAIGSIGNKDETLIIKKDTEVEQPGTLTVPECVTLLFLSEGRLLLADGAVLARSIVVQSPLTAPPASTMDPTQTRTEASIIDQ